MFQAEKANSQVARSKSRIVEALLQLMEEKQFSDITISEICDRAGVGRPTYYRHYNSKDDIILGELDRIYFNFLESVVSQYGESPPPQEVITEVFEYWRQNRRINELLIKHNLNGLLSAALERHFGRLREHKIFTMRMDPYLSELIVGGIPLVLIQWVKKGMQESSEEMASTISSFFNPKYFLTVTS
jgi:AcrR family transcriptional regulator